MNKNEKEKKINKEISLVGRHKGKVLWKKLLAMYDREWLFYNTYTIFNSLDEKYGKDN